MGGRRLFLHRYPAVEDLHLNLASDLCNLGEGAGPFNGVHALSVTTDSRIRFGLDVLPLFPNLEVLSVYGAVDVVGLDGFSCNPKLKVVFIEVNGKCELNIEWLGNLEEVTCWPWRHPSMKELRQLTQLRQLNLSQSPALESLDGLQYLPDITSVDVSDCDELVDISPAVVSSSLARLDISGCDEIASEDLEDLSST